MVYLFFRSRVVRAKLAFELYIPAITLIAIMCVSRVIANEININNFYYNCAREIFGNYIFNIFSGVPSTRKYLWNKFQISSFQCQKCFIFHWMSKYFRYYGVLSFFPIIIITTCVAFCVLCSLVTIAIVINILILLCSFLRLSKATYNFTSAYHLYSKHSLLNYC